MMYLHSSTSKYKNSRSHHVTGMIHEATVKTFGFAVALLLLSIISLTLDPDKQLLASALEVN